MAAAAPDSAAGGHDTGRVHVFSSHDMPFVSDRHEVSLAAGGSQALELDAGAGRAGDIYWVLGSASGVTPPFMSNGVPLPLVLANFTVFTVKFANSGMLSGSAGLLDGAGKASMTFNVPAASDPGLDGVTLYWAYYVYDVQVQPVFSSNPLPITLTQ